ncbi:C-type lectin domain family 4 member G-like [Eublepharis macularius]|uniref:C-type lectin domain family 4 member G-like n=1 Tax=Eublepharis macularius TaxID=481883 RepID=A0AA97KXG1_EUBMA|nr:C-type lectin domain family 4 member G-like [Eublepharis macularius]
MAPGGIYTKCEEPDTDVVKDNMFDKRTGGFLLQQSRCCSQGTSISVLYIANAVLFLLWIITIIIISGKYSRMTKELERLHSEQTLLSGNDTYMVKQLEVLHSNQSTYATELNNSLQRLEHNQNKLKQDVTKLQNDLTTEKKKIWDETFKLQNALQKLNASACKMCPEGWLLNKGKCYYFHEQEIHWSLAKNFCENQGSHLVVINDADEQMFLQSKKKRYLYWIGLHDMKNENTFVWVDDSPLSYTHWFAGEPNDYGHGEDCVTMTERGWWNDYACGREVTGTICEKPWNCQ